MNAVEGPVALRITHATVRARMETAIDEGDGHIPARDFGSGIGDNSFRNAE